MVDIRDIEIERDDLHEMLGGGFPSASLAIIEGRYGTGKSVLTQRLTYGFLENDYAVSVISSELTVKGFIEQMASLGYNITSYLLDRNLLFIPIYGMISQANQQKNYVEQLMTGQRIFESDVIILDTFSALVSKDEDPEQSLVDLEGFFQRLLAQSKTIILTIESGPTSSKLFQAFYSAAHVLFELGLNQQGGKVSQEIDIKRFAKAGGSVSQTIAFRVEPGIGFVLEITSVG